MSSSSTSIRIARTRCGSRVATRRRTSFCFPVSETWGWGSLALLGAYHGLNPAMGWLFAVALGMQEHSGQAVLAALRPDRARPCGVDRSDGRGARARLCSAAAAVARAQRRGAADRLRRLEAGAPAPPALGGHAARLRAT